MNAKRYEHKVVSTLTSGLSPVIRHEENDGWECCCVCGTIIVFKRPVGTDDVERRLKALEARGETCAEAKTESPAPTKERWGVRLGSRWAVSADPSITVGPGGDNREDAVAFDSERSAREFVRKRAAVIGLDESSYGVERLPDAPAPAEKPAGPPLWVVFDGAPNGLIAYRRKDDADRQACVGELVIPYIPRALAEALAAALHGMVTSPHGHYFDGTSVIDRARAALAAFEGKP